MIRLVFFLIFAMLALTGRCEPTFDMRSGESAQTSLDAMEAEMTDVEKAHLDAAIQIIQVAINSIMWEVQLGRVDESMKF